ncbi:MAG: hypothetical protein OEV44_08535 [Spirochaetota bacterium]|nr:hypothetical protein [Spirochaetota bacterium]
MDFSIIDFAPNNKKELKRFVNFALKLYIGDNNYVPPLKSELLGNKLFGIKGLLTKDHPFHEHTKIHYFMAQSDNKVVGRLAVCINYNYNEYHNVKVGSFGFFEVIENYDVAKQLLDEGIKWIKNQGMTQVLGPLNFSQDQTLGILIEGFEFFPYINTVYNKKYYSNFLEKYGFSKAKDLIAQLMPVKITDETTKKRHERLNKVIERLKREKGITVRQINMKNNSEFIEDVKLSAKIYNEAWANNWGILPVTEEDAIHAANELKLIADPGLFNFAYVKGKPAAMIISLPDVNEMSWPGNNFFTRLDFVRLIKIFLKRKKIKRVRLWALGILNEYKKMGLDAVLYHESFNNAHKRNYEECELSWILEDNVLVLRAGESMGAKTYKKWRLYEMPLENNK